MPAYNVVDLHTSVRIGQHLQLFAAIDKLFNARYATYGIPSDPTGIGAPGIPPNGVTNGPGVDNRFQSPAPPFGAYGGIRLSLGMHAHHCQPAPPARKAARSTP
jgi:iron complex outermembrane recepter protein